MASKMKSTLLTMSLTLLLITGIASALLAYVYTLTKDPITQAENQKKEQALSLVLPKFDNSPLEDTVKIASGVDTLICYIGKNNNEIVGIAVESFTDEGFSGRFSVMVGFLPDGTIYNTMILEHKETPGLGDKMENEKSMSISGSDTTWWSKQFIGKKPEFNTSESDGKKYAEPINIKVSKDGGEIDAITAATISSRAYCNAVNRACATYFKIGELKGKSGGKAHYVLILFLALGLFIFIFKKLNK
ncbi:MAG: RnfABCDGE type electron transport complex subunit G [Paludibacteraceae bacterium]|nr:RnfABCDGE type electron transport complex subunit G [Paludibacteraceae bacterium]